jgi:hypothetical protein
LFKPSKSTIHPCGEEKLKRVHNVDLKKATMECHTLALRKTKNYKTIYLSKPFGVYINMLDLKP